MEKLTYTEQYDANNNLIGISRSDGWWIPINESNSDYQTYLRWVENPNAPEFQTFWVEPQLTK